jgi:hypothetical protein
MFALEASFKGRNVPLNRIAVPDMSSEELGSTPVVERFEQHLVDARNRFTIGQR